MEISTGKCQFDTTISTRTLYNYIENGVFLNLTNKDLPRQGKTQKRRYRRVRKAQRNVGGKSIIKDPKRPITAWNMVIGRWTALNQGNTKDVAAY